MIIILGVLLICLFGLVVLCCFQDNCVSTKDVKNKTKEECINILKHLPLKEWPSLPGKWEPVDDYSVKPPNWNDYVESIHDDYITFCSSTEMSEDGNALNYGIFYPNKYYIGYLHALEQCILYTGKIKLNLS